MGLRKGFTLIELLVVITILAVLAGAALPFIQGYVEDSRIAKAKSDLDEISRALAVYEMREGDYPTTTISLLTGRYLNKSPTDPWGQVYGVKTAQGIVFSSGPDKKNSVVTGNAGDDTDNIIAYYQPPLALVSVKWADSNQTGQIDSTNPPDRLTFNFSRAMAPSTDTTVNTAGINAVFFLNTTMALTPTFITAGSAVLSSDKRSLTMTIGGAGLVVKSDTIRVQTGAGANNLKDQAGTTCLSGQDVFITEQ